MRRWMTGWSVVGLCLVICADAKAEDLTITTYYPSPRGVYDELRTMNNTFLAVQRGRVGIATSDPQVLLHLRESGGLRAAIRLESTGGSADTWDISSADDGGFGTLAISAVSAVGRVMTLREDGNVGIGTASPQGRLHVLGRPWTGSYIPEFTLEAPTHINAIFDRTDTQDFLTLTVGSVGTGLHFGDSNRFFISADPYADRNTGSAGNEVFSIMATGNVGIGTTSPDKHLTIHASSGDLNSAIHLTSANTGTAPSADGLLLESFGRDLGGYLWNYENAPLRFGTNNALRVLIDPRGALGVGPVSSDIRLINVADTTWSFVVRETGNVGIGTASPNERLVVAGRTRIIEGAQGTFGGHLYLAKADGTPGNGLWHLNITPTGRAGVTGNALNFVESGIMDYRMVIAPGGNVGIGTASPDQRLHVMGTIHATGQVLADSDARFKTHVLPVTGVLAKVGQLQAVSFERSALARALGHPAAPQGRELGVIGQELEQVFPELVVASGEAQYRSVDYSRLSVVLLEAIKELTARQEVLERRIRELEGVEQRDVPRSDEQR